MKSVDPAFRRAGLGDGSLGRHSRPRFNAGSAARLCGQAQPAQAAVVRRHRRGSHLRAHVTSAGLERAVCEALHDPQWHENRPLGSGAKDGGFLGGSGFVHVVRQLCSLEYLQRTLFLGSHQAAPGCWQAGTQDRLARLRGWEDDRCQLCHNGPGTMFRRCYECPALQTERDMHVSQEVRQAARSLQPQHREQIAHGIFPSPANWFTSGFMPSFVAPSAPRRAPGRAGQRRSTTS